MNNTSEIIQYFLGELSDAEVERFEARVFSDEQFAESVFAVEEELLEAYARGELPDDQRLRLEHHHLTTAARREDLELTKGLIHLSSHPASKGRIVQTAEGPSDFWTRLSSAWRFWPAYATVLLLLTLAGAWWWTVNRDGQPRVNGDQNGLAINKPATSPQTSVTAATPIVATSTPGQNDVLASDTPRSQNTLEPPGRAPNTPRQSETAIAVFSINPGLLRSEGSGEQVLSIPASSGTVRLRAVLRDDSVNVMRAELHTADGEYVFTRYRKDLRLNRAGKFISIEFPARLLTPRVYLLRFFDQAGEPVESYSFRVAAPTP